MHAGFADEIVDESHVIHHLAQRRAPNSAFLDATEEDLRARGIPTEQEYVARYCELTGRDGIPDLDFYLAFQLFRSAGIMQGIAARVREGCWVLLLASVASNVCCQLVSRLAETAIEDREARPRGRFPPSSRIRTGSGPRARKPR